ncbi:hypothetical protein [uncultured Flavobacterium sp.]|uniref:hypothetical protein n=1 Tax=uncultured Flavobacterium sp. TaxID=165435 RepID=UPI0030CA460F|tara:strand:- start:359 stop:877 length:519 start_codon:yes stop_codon:yes gene_type:complete
MKKLFLLFFIVFICNSCDDGEITLESFNFSDATITKCNDEAKTFLYKVKDQELLLLDISDEVYTHDSSQTTFPYTKTYDITGTTSAIYRIYDDNLPETFICNSIAPASPIVTNEWSATGGTLQVTTSERFDTTNTNLLGYTFTIKLLNINFSNANNSFSFEEYLFGNYQTSN